MSPARSWPRIASTSTSTTPPNWRSPLRSTASWHSSPDAGLPRQRLFGVGAAISAPVRRDGASIAAAGILPGWSAVSPQRELARRLGVPVHVGNDANLGALAEVRTGAAGGPPTSST